MNRRVALWTALTIAAWPVYANNVTLLTTRSPRAAKCVAFAQSETRQSSAPCGTPLTVASSDTGWIESDGEITPFLADLDTEGTLRLDPLVAAGEVRLPTSLRLGSDEAVVFFSLVTPPKGRRSFHRRLTGGDRATMPAGRVIGVLLDARGRGLAISRPVTAPAHGSIEIPLERPAGGVDLLAIVERPPTPKEARAELAVVDTKGRHLPAVTAGDEKQMLAAWYGLERGEIQLTVESDAYRLPAEPVQSRSRDSIVIRKSLQLLPTLTVAIAALPAHTEEPPMSLSVLKVGEKTPIRTVVAKAGQTLTLESLPASALDVVLTIGGFVTGARADLSGGDARVEIPLKPIVITGVVYYGSEPARAEIRLLQHGEPLVVKTDERGQYTLAIWAPQHRVFVDTTIVDKPGMPPFRDVPAFEESRTYDIHVPAFRFAARVFDAVDQTPVSGAEIALSSTYMNPESNRPSHEMRAFRTTADPLTELPPLRPGSAEVRVRASGYEEAGPIAVTIEETLPERIIDVPLKRSGEAVDVHLVLPDGSAASGAEMAATNDAMQLTWQGVANAVGVVRLPKSVYGSLVLIRHPAAASHAFVLQGSLDALPPLQLASPAPPLTVSFVDAQGAPIGPRGASVAAWFRGYRLTDSALAFVTWSSPVTMSDGRWSAKNAPQSALRVVASRKGSASLTNGNYDALATVIQFPWTGAATVRVAD